MTNFKEATREALEFLRTKAGDTGVLATVDASGQPFASTVYYVMDDEFNFHFLTAQDTHKAHNLAANNKVAFTVGVGPEYISVMIRGTAVRVTGPEQNAVLPLFQKLMDKHEAYGWPVRKLDDLAGQNLLLYKVTAEKVTFLNIDSSDEPRSNADHLYHLKD